MANKDFYAALGVPKTATDDEIKKAFRRLAHEHHPDKGGDQQKFKDINEAYQVLGDKDKRSQYDKFGSAAFENGGQGGFGGGGFGFDPSQGFGVNMEDMGDLGDILGGMFGFGGAGGGARQKRGQDIEVDVALDFLESIFGARKKVKLYKHDPCSSCKGSGAEAGSGMVQCKTCDGKGKVQRAQRTIFGMVQAVTTCSECMGKGQVPEKVCHTCKGAGIERHQKEIELDIPAGISEGESLRVNGEGEFPGHGGRPGDLFVRISVKHHPVFTREGSDILSTVDVPFSTMALGGTVDIETADGPGNLKIPEGTASGTVFRLRAKGVPFLRSNGRGDHLVTVNPSVPKKLSREQKSALDALRGAGL